MNSIKILKFFMICITGVFGLFGFTMGLSVIVINILEKKKESAINMLLA